MNQTCELSGFVEQKTPKLKQGTANASPDPARLPGSSGYTEGTERPGPAAESRVTTRSSICVELCNFGFNVKANGGGRAFAPAPGYEDKSEET